MELIQKNSYAWGCQLPAITVSEGGNANIYVQQPSYEPPPLIAPSDIAPLDWLRAQISEMCELAHAA